MPVSATPLPLSLLLALSLSPLALAEIREIPAEEMTEAYIRDTTVVVPQQTPPSSSTGVSVTVKPLQTLPGEGPAAPGNDGPRPDLTPLTDQYLSEQRNQTLEQIGRPGYEGAPFDPLQAQREEYLRALLGLESGVPIDYSSLQFPTNVPPASPPPAGIAHSIQPGQFTISIPNSNHYAPSSHQTPGGEYQINVTPSDIIFTINLPAR